MTLNRYLLIAFCALLPSLVRAAGPAAPAAPPAQDNDLLNIVPGNLMTDEQLARTIRVDVNKWMALYRNVPNLAGQSQAAQALALSINADIEKFNSALPPGGKKLAKIDAFGEDFHVGFAMSHGFAGDSIVGATLIDGQNKYCFPCENPGKPFTWGLVPFVKKERNTTGDYYPYLKCLESLQRAGVAGETRVNADSYTATTFLPVASHDPNGVTDGKGFYIVTDDRIDGYEAAMPGSTKDSKGAQNYMISVGRNKEINSITIVDNGAKASDNIPQKSYHLYENPDGKNATDLTKANGPIQMSDAQVASADISVQLDIRDKMEALEASVNIPKATKCEAVKNCVDVAHFDDETLPPWHAPGDTIENVIKLHTDNLKCTASPSGARPAGATVKGAPAAVKAQPLSK